MIRKLRTALLPGFLRDVLVMISGTVAGQIVMLLSLPIVTRLYFPADFGVLGVYVSIVFVLSVSACLRLDMAMPLPEHDEEAVNLLVLSLIVASLFSLLIAAPVVMAPVWISERLNQPGLQPYLWLLPLGVWVAAVYSAFQMWSVRKKRFAEIAKTQLYRALASAGTQVGMAINSPNPGGLILGHFLYMGWGTGRLAFLFRCHDRNLLAHVTWPRLLENLRKQYRFPVYSAPEAVLNAAAVYLPIVLIGAIVGPAEAGFLLLAQRITSMPAGLIGSNLARVYLGEATNKRAKGELGSFTLSTMKSLFKLGLVPFALLAVVAPFFFPYVFGEGWTRAGVMVAWMVPFTLVRFAGIPVATILMATSRQRQGLILQIFGFIAVVGAIMAASALAPGYVFEAYACASLLYYSVYVVVLINVALAETGEKAT